MPKMPAPTRTPRWPRSPPASRTGRLSDRRQNRNGDDAPGHERHLPAGGVASRSTNSGEWTASGSPHAMHNSGGCDAGAAPRSRIVCRGGGADDGLFGPRPGKEDQDRRDFRPHRSARRRRVGAAIYRRRGFTNATARAGRPISSNRERPSCVRRLRRAIYFGSCTQRRGILILPNPWDAGTAKLLASLGFEALATTSLGMSNALGRVDGEGSVSRAELLENCRIIAEATDLPVNADLENGYADDPKEAATILRDAAAVGIVGGSIEDWSGERIYEFNHAVERVAAGAEMARSLPVPFTFVARAENLIRGRLDLDDTIKRLQAFEKAGADVLYAPGLRDLETMRTVVQAIGKPLNVVMSAADPALTAAEMEAVGVKRLSVGGALSRLALAAFMKGAREMKEQGGFTWVRDAMPNTDLKAVFGA